MELETVQAFLSSASTIFVRNFFFFLHFLHLTKPSDSYVSIELNRYVSICSDRDISIRISPDTSIYWSGYIDINQSRWIGMYQRRCIDMYGSRYIYINRLRCIDLYRSRYIYMCRSRRAIDAYRYKSIDFPDMRIDLSRSVFRYSSTGSFCVMSCVCRRLCDGLIFIQSSPTKC